MSNDGKGAGKRSSTGHGLEPDDAYRGLVAPLPADREEAAADRAMADAERAVVTGSADDDMRARVAHVSEARSQEDRRRLWSSYGS